MNANVYDYTFHYPLKKTDMYCYIFIEHLSYKDFMNVHLLTLRAV